MLATFFSAAFPDASFKEEGIKQYLWFFLINVFTYVDKKREESALFYLHSILLK